MKSKVRSINTFLNKLENYSKTEHIKAFHMTHFILKVINSHSHTPSYILVKSKNNIDMETFLKASRRQIQAKFTC